MNFTATEPAAASARFISRPGTVQCSSRTMPQLLKRPQRPPHGGQAVVVHRPPSSPGTIKTLDPSSSGVSTPSDVLRLMDALQLPLDAAAYVSLIKECTCSRDAVQGAAVHAHIKSRGESILLLLASRLVLMYAACGRVGDARKVFDEMPVKDPISWVIMIAALSEYGDYREAGQLFAGMHESSRGRAGACYVDAVVAVLRSCVQWGDLRFGQQVHGVTLKLLGASACTADSYLLCNLVKLYTVLGIHECAEKLTDMHPPECSTARASLISRYCFGGRFDRALVVFRMMKREGNKKGRCQIFSSILTACTRVGDEGCWSGMQVHADAIKLGFESDLYVGSSLVDMYGKCGRVGEARRAFDKIDCSRRDHACWNAMFSTLVRVGSSVEALRLLYEMKAAGIEPRESMLDHIRVAFGS